MSFTSELKGEQTPPPIEKTRLATTSEPLEGYELVASLMRQQDEVLADLDALYEQVEATIKKIQDQREEATAEASVTGVAEESLESTMAQPFAA